MQPQSTNSQTDSWKEIRGVRVPDDKTRFEIELEFVQCLADPYYLRYLSDKNYFKNASFLGYLHYLQYWHRPEYAVFINFPSALFFLHELQRQEFRDGLQNPSFCDMLHLQQHRHWNRHNFARKLMAQRNVDNNIIK